MRHGAASGGTRRSRWLLGALAAPLALAACSGPGPAAPETSPTLPAPDWYLDDQLTSTQRASAVVVDAAAVYLVDESGDFLFGADPSANWDRESGLALTWAQVPGATKYRVLGRNAATAPADWKELKVVTAPDRLLQPTVSAANLNPWTAGLGTGGNPWSFGNVVEFSVVAEDDTSTLAGGLTGPLATTDAFPGVVTGVELDRPGLPVPFDPRVERGATFTKSIRIGFSEPMRTFSEPVRAEAHPELVSLGANVTIRRLLASAWGDDAASPAATAPGAAAHAFLSLELSVAGSCTESLVARSPGDRILAVRDVTLLGVGARLLFLDGVTGAALGEGGEVSEANLPLERLTLRDPLPIDLPAGALACAIGGPGSAPRLLGEDATRLTVSEVRRFYVGEPVAIHTSAAGGAGPLHDVRQVVGVDSVAGVLVVATPLSTGHATGAGAVVVALDGLGGEVALRPSAALTLVRDALGGPDTQLFVAAPAGVMVDDLVLVDADGRLETTPDQAQARVREVRFAPAAGGTPSLVLDLPASLTLLHGRARVIALGDAFSVGGTRDTSAPAPTPLDPHGDQFSPDGLRY